MFQLSLTVLLALSISAKFASTIEEFNVDTGNLNNGLLVGVKNNNETKEFSTTQEEPNRNVRRDNFTLQRDQQKVNTTEEQARKPTLTSLTSGTPTSSIQNVTPNMTRPIEETTALTEKEAVTQNVGNFTGEQDNLNQCCVNPPDEDEKDVVTIKTMQEKPTSVDSSLGTTPPSIETTTNSTETTTIPNDFVPPKFFPVTKDVTSITNVSSNIAARLNTTMYKTFAPEETEEATSKISTLTVVATISSTIPTPTVTTDVVTKVTTVSKTNQTKNGNGKMAVEGLENLQQAKLSEKGKESNDGSKNESMPPGIIALVTAISFVVAIAIGYISMVVWKQYLEHRYGRRELLVNELEFDTNDLRHFEL